MFNISVNSISETKFTNEGSFLQTPFWGEFKARHGWKVSRFELKAEIPVIQEGRKCESSETSSGNDFTEKRMEVSVLTRSFAKGHFTIAYVPLFPKLPYECSSEEEINGCFDSENQEVVLSKNIMTPEMQTIEFASFISETADALKAKLPSNTICIKFDPAVEFPSPEIRDEFNLGLRIVSYADRLSLKKNKVDIQPPDSTQIDLSGSEEEILSRMKSKWRYNIKLSEKKGVVVKRTLGNAPDLSEKIDQFYTLFKITSERDGIAIHSKDYLTDLIKTSSEEIQKGKDVPEVSLYLAEHEGDVLGGIITLFSKTESIYLYGASSNVKRNLMPNFLLQWTAMKDAKAYGSSYYDMYGMPPTSDENHPMHGLYLFKTGFGGKNIHRPGTYDVPLKGIYRLYTVAEKLRAFWHKIVLKKIRGR